MAIRQKGQVTLYDFTDKYTVNLPGSISLSAGVNSLGSSVSRVIYTPIKRGNTSLTTADTDETIQMSGIPTVTILDYTENDRSVTPFKVQVSSVSFDTNSKLLYFTLTFQSTITTDGSVILAISFTDSATDDTITLNEQINFSLSNKGASGINTATVFLYKRNAISPTVPQNDVTYTFANSSASGTDISNSGWTQTIPSGNNTLYTIYATASSSDSTDTIASSEWQGPIQVEGNEGVSGWNRAIVYLYKRSASSPTAPSGSRTYTFSSGAISGSLDGWQMTMPAQDSNGNPCWVCSASFASQDTTATGTFQNVVKLVENGEDSYEISVIASPTDRFVNTRIACTLTAYVFKGGIMYEDITDGDDVDQQLSDEGLIVKWYTASGNAWMEPSPNDTVQRTGVEQIITAGDVSDSISLVAQLEDISS